MKTRATYTAAGALILSATAALAGGSSDPAMLTFGFTDLNIDYDTDDGNTGTLVGSSQANSAGDVTDIPNDTTVRFGAGYAMSADAFDATFAFDIFNITDSSADATGTFSITDLDGDAITGSIEGAWSFTDTLNVLTFSGNLSAVTVDTNAGNAMFEGTDGDQFALDPMDTEGGLSGGLVELSFAPDTFFSESFDGYNAAFSGVVVPAPGALALLALGAAAPIRRKRR